MTTNTELIKRLKAGASISRSRGINLDFAAIADKAADTIEAQAKQIEALRKDWKRVSDENGFLRFEAAKQIEALQANAERYQWLRSCNLAKHQAVRDGFELGDEKLDEAIDAARKQGGAT